MQKQSWYAVFAALLLVTLGLSSFLYKGFVLNFPLWPNQQVDSWHFEVKLSFAPQSNKSGQLTMSLPRSSGRYSIVDESFISDGYGLVTDTDQETGNRYARWSKRRPDGVQTLFYRSILYRVNNAQRKPLKDVEVQQARYLDYEIAAENEPVMVTIGNLSDSIQEKSVDASSFTGEFLRRIKNNHPDVTQLRKQVSRTIPFTRVVAAVFQKANIPARVMNGVFLKEGYTRHIMRQWVEVYNGSRWLMIDVENGKRLKHSHLLPWWEGTESFWQLKNGRKLDVQVSLKQHLESALTEAVWSGDVVSKAVYNFSLFSLPLEMQMVFHVLLLVPLGALVCTILRQIIGLNTFGTFMPVLIALAFRETHLFYGLLLFGFIVWVGLVCRRFVDRLRLLMVPRLVCILTVIVILMYAIALVTSKLDIYMGLSVALFPLVILTMLIERVSVSYEEQGRAITIKQTINTFIVASICYAVVSHPYLIHLMVTFPELLLVVMGFALLVGRYNGYKLTEYMRFAHFRASDDARIS